MNIGAALSMISDSTRENQFPCFSISILAFKAGKDLISYSY
jgi:hypothetical protein